MTTIDKKSTVPHEGGIYTFTDKKTQKVLYEGQSNDIARRIKEHMHDGRTFADTKSNTITYIPISNKKKRLVLEKKLIIGLSSIGQCEYNVRNNVNRKK